MKKKLYLHIGSPKTGTSSIQEVFASNRGLLEAQGVSYPANDICHHLLYFVANQQEEEWPRQFKGVPVKKIQQAFRNHLASIDQDLKKSIDYYVVSSEYFFFSDPQAVDNTLDFLDDFFESIEVVVFVRCPVSFYTSSQQQVIKASSRVMPPWEFYYNFRRVIEAWEGRAKVTVFGHWPGMDSLETLCRHIGVDDSHFYKDQERHNASISVEHMLLLEKLQKRVYPGQDNVFKPHLAGVQNIGVSGLSKPKVNDDVKAFIQQCHESDLEWLSRKYGVRLLSSLSEKEEVEVGELKERMGEHPGVKDIYSFDDDKVEELEAVLMDRLLKVAVKS